MRYQQRCLTISISTTTMPQRRSQLLSRTAKQASRRWQSQLYQRLSQRPIHHQPTPVIHRSCFGFGTGQTQTVTASSASQAATSITTTSFTSNAAYGIGTAVVPIPNIAENPSNANLKANQSSVLEQYSGNLLGGAFTGSATTGAGNRSMQVVFVFKNSTNGGSTSNGNYTTFWLVNVSSAAAANNYVDHLINTPMRCDNLNNISASCLIKI